MAWEKIMNVMFWLSRIFNNNIDIPNEFKILKKTPLYDLLCDPEFQLSETGFCRLLVNLIDSLQELRQNRIYFSDLHLKNIYSEFFNCLY